MPGLSVSSFSLREHIEPASKGSKGFIRISTGQGKIVEIESHSYSAMGENILSQGRGEMF